MNYVDTIQIGNKESITGLRCDRGPEDADGMERIGQLYGQQKGKK